MSKFTESTLYETSEEWYTDLDELLEEIEHYCDFYKITLPYILQIKEKYGELRVYYSAQEDWIEDDYTYVDYLIERTDRIFKGEDVNTDEENKIGIKLFRKGGN